MVGTQLHFLKPKSIYIDNLIILYFNKRLKLSFTDSMTLNKLNVCSITFGDDFNLPLDGLDFSNITHITFGHEFNQSLTNRILNLNNVIQLKFGNNFDQSLD